MRVSLVVWISVAPFIVFLVVVGIHFCVRRKPLFPPIWVRRLPAVENDKLEKLTQLGHRVFTLLNDNHLPYVVICGSLLGIVRHDGHMIPWDDDIDIAVPESHKDQILDLFRDRGYTVTKKEVSYHVWDEEEHIFVDVFIMMHKEDKYIYKSTDARFLWKDEWLEENVFTFPGSVQRSFCNSHVRVPKNFTEYLDRAYPKWDEKACLGLVHSGKMKDKLRFYFNAAIAPFCTKLK